MARKKTAGSKLASPLVPAGPALDPVPAASPEEPEVPPAEVQFPIVGIGASAGGLAAFEAFFSAMPADRDPGMAFVLVQHLAPDHKSLLSELVQRCTRMEVLEVEDGMVVDPNCTYIIPPNHDLAFINGRLQLLEPGAPHGHRLPIDFFFRSLAQDQRERAVGIVLSGTGSDGTLGLRAIKGEGGLVLVQNPDSTEYDGMPRSAIGTGLVDYVLPPAEMPARLIAYATHVSAHRSIAAAAAPQDTNTLNKILVLLRTQTGHDFAGYKQTTIRRRIAHRQALLQIAHLGDYLRYLQQEPAEAEALFGDLLIGVTQFFRDPQVFEVLEKQVIPGLFAGKAEGSLIRVWVPGCSTGEEAYSLAILLQEHLESLPQGFGLQVFATDIDRRAIEQARTGYYPASISADISPERLSRFFTSEGEGAGYRIRTGIRDLLVFSEQNVIRDPPFSKLDLLSCRNLLIYLDGPTQQWLLPQFHYSLNPGGVLLLGTSETVGGFRDHWVPLDSKGRLFQRREGTYPGHPAGNAGWRSRRTTPEAGDPPSVKKPDAPAPSVRELTEQALLEARAPAGVLVDEHGDIRYIHGRTGQYLEPAPGEARANILKMAREGLDWALTAALRQAAGQQEPVHHPDLQVRTNGDFSAVDMTVQPVAAGAGSTAGSHLFLVILEPAAGSGQGLPVAGKVPGEEPTQTEATVALLQQELRAKDENLRGTTEQLQTANEELRSANEELQSLNEELQSANEELETSKEELQSINEELTTVNAELQQKIGALTRVNDDLNNLMASTGVGTLFVGHQQQIRKFAPAISEVINLIPTDVGRPLAHLTSTLPEYHRLVEDVQGVLDTLIPAEVEVQTRGGAWFLMRIRPYRTRENVIEGAVITFFDITERKQAQEVLREQAGLHRLAAVVRDSRDAILMLDFQGRILGWNPGATRIYGWSETEALAMNIRQLVPENRRQQELARLHQLSQAEVLEPYETDRIAKDGRVKKVWMTATMLSTEAGQAYAITTTERERRDHRHSETE